MLDGNSLAVQWLGLRAFIARAQVQSLVRELRSCKLRGVAKKKKKAHMLESMWRKGNPCTLLVGKH